MHFLQSFCQTFVAQEEKYQQRYLTSFKLALQIEEFHYWNWELMFNIFCRICGSLLRPFFWVWRACFQVWICKNCCAGQGHGWWIVPIISSCLGEMKEQDEHNWLFSNVFQASHQSGTWGALVLTNVASVYLIILKGFLSRDSCLCSKTHKFLVPAVTLSVSSRLNHSLSGELCNFVAFNLIPTSFFVYEERMIKSSLEVFYMPPWLQSTFSCLVLSFAL